MAKKLIAALQVSLDGYAQGSDRGGEEWVDSWADALGLLRDVGSFIQGAGMYPGYAEYWSAIEAAPESAPPFQTRLPYPREVEYARFAAKTPHYVLSRTLEAVTWPPSAQIVRGLDELRALTQRGNEIAYVVGGPTLVKELLEAELLDELRLIVHPLLLGGGKALLSGLGQRRALTFVQAEPLASGKVVLTYRTS